jgi:hypothetical protein
MMVFLMLFSCLSAITYTTDDCIDLVMMFGYFRNINSIPCFVSRYYDEAELPAKDFAITYLADTGSVLTIVQNNLDTYTATDDTDKMKDVKIVVCPYQEDGAEYLAAIDLTYILDRFGRDELTSLTQDQQIEFCEKIVRQYGVFEEMTYDFDE